MSLERPHRKSVRLGQNEADLPLLLLSLLVQGRPKHLLGRRGEPVETSCTTEEEGPGVCSVTGREEGTPTCKGHRVRLTPRWKGSYNHTEMLSGETGLDIQW